MIISLLEVLRSGEKLNTFNNENIKNKIIITDEITPKDVIDIHHNKGLGVISSHGSRTSHSAILSRSLSLPMIVLEVESSVSMIKNSDQLIMDPDNEVIVIGSNELELKYFKIQSQKKSLIKSFEEKANKKAVTKDRRN